MNCLSAGSGGAVSYIRNLLPELNRLFEESSNGHRLIVLGHQSQKHLFQSIPESQCVLINGPRLGGYRRLWWEYCNIHRIVYENNADVLFAPHQIGRKIPGVKQVLMFRNMDPFMFHRYRHDPRLALQKRLMMFFSRRSLQVADRIIAVSDYVKGVLVSRLNIPESRIRRIYHGRDSRFSSNGDSQADENLLGDSGLKGDYVLTCGSLQPYRRCEDVIAAFDRAAENLGNGFNLVIAGSGTNALYSRVVKRAIDISQCRDRIFAVGHVSSETMQALYRRCSMCVIATEVEACPNIAIEAMSSGCVIISSDKPPLPEIFQGCSAQFRSRDINDLALKMSQYMNDNQLRSNLKKRALERSKAFSWARCAKRTYSTLLNWPQ